MAGRASQAVADTVKGSGQYIEEAKLSGMAHDVEHVIKNHPIPALLVCFGIGYCIGRAMKDYARLTNRRYGEPNSGPRKRSG